ALISYVRHYFSGLGPDPTSAAPVEDTMTKVLALLRARNKLDFRSYRKRMLQRRIQRRMGLAQVRDMEEYLALLRERPEEVRLLSKDLFISLTSFFRDPPIFEILTHHHLPTPLDPGPARAGARQACGCAAAHLGAGVRHRRGGVLARDDLHRADRGERQALPAADLRERRGIGCARHRAPGHLPRKRSRRRRL